jgi:hypothetical protein
MLPRLTVFAVDRPKLVIGILLGATVLFALQFPSIRIDTDPENMLEAGQPDRVLYNEIKEGFGVNDLIVVGIVAEDGIFRAEALAAVARATEQILAIRGVVISDVVSLTTTDNVKSAGGLLDIHPVMGTVPVTAEGIASLRRDIADNPFLHEKIASADGTALALYVPIERKDMSFLIAGEIEAILQRQLPPGLDYHLAGLPVAEDTFGHEMFLQMAVTAPLAFMGILLLVYLLFRRAAFLVPVGMDAMLSVVWAMGLLIGSGQTVHIMSSMIPVFLMPIAVLDDVHILSAFFDTYKKIGEKRAAVLEAMKPLYRPMLYTSLTSAVGFASLALADIPPVRVFGIFVAFGIMVAWLLSMTMVPAVIGLMSEERLRRAIHEPGSGGGLRDQSNGGGARGFDRMTGSQERARRGEEDGSPARIAPRLRAPLLDRVVRCIGGLSVRRARAMLAMGLVLLALGIAGVAQIEINDNPVKWFKQGHRIRVADELMNRLFGGTYMAYLLVEGDEPGALKRPETLAYLDRMQSHLEAEPLVGKTSSVADIVARINLVLHDNDPEYDRVPDTAEAAGQFLFLYESSGDPDDLDDFIDREARRANVWVQMKGGDNRQMTATEENLERFIRAEPPPAGVGLRWSGLTYINKVWQDLMVFGMLKAVLGSFAVVFVLLLVEFRSLRLGALAMVPLTVAIVLSYGIVGWSGKSYDMPIAVCSALSLGLAIDFAIHYLHRFKARYEATADLEGTHAYMSGEPLRAIARNAIVITLGFLPLTVSSLTPYVTVGIFFALLMIFSTLSTLLLLPAAMQLFGHRALEEKQA